MNIEHTNGHELQDPTACTAARITETVLLVSDFISYSKHYVCTYTVDRKDGCYLRKYKFNILESRYMSSSNKCI